MADRPIHFSAPMVRALLDGRKTQTRRVLRPRPGAQAQWLSAELLHSSPSCYLATVDGQLGAQMQHPLAGSMRNGIATDAMSPLTWIRLPYASGDRLWVRENWQALSHGDYLPTKSQPCDLRYAATERLACLTSEVRGYPWRPSIHMPRWASRLTLTVTDVRVQRLQEITLEDAAAEGWGGYVRSAESDEAGNGPRTWFRKLWNSIHGPGAWDANPWVCAITFTTHRCNIDQMEADHGGHPPHPDRLRNLGRHAPQDRWVSGLRGHV